MTTLTTSTTHLVRCSVGEHAIGLVMQGVDGVDRMDRVRPVHDQPGVLGTIASANGERQVFRLADYLGLPHRSTSRLGQVVLLNTASGRFGLAVDRVSPVFRLPSSNLKSCPPGFTVRERSLFANVAIHDDEPILMLAPDRLMQENQAAPSLNMRDVTFPPATGGLLVFDLLRDKAQGERRVGFGVPAGWVAEIADTDRVVSVPGSPPYLRGVIARRGQPVAVIDLAAWLGLRPPMENFTRVVIVPTDRGTIALATSAGVRLQDRSAPHISSRRVWPGSPEQLRGAIDFDELSVLIPNLSALV